MGLVVFKFTVYLIYKPGVVISWIEWKKNHFEALYKKYKHSIHFSPFDIKNIQKIKLLDKAKMRIKSAK